MNKSNIQWTDYTWNPWQGCRKVSAGCKNCYMFRDKKRFGQNPEEVKRSAPATFNKPLSIHFPAKIFTCSWSDFFISKADPWRDEAWDIIRQTPHLTYQILTKRPERVLNCLPYFWEELKNVWLGVTVEEQKHLERIIPIAKASPSVLFISVEPMLEPLNIFYGLNGVVKKNRINSAHRAINWVICGGESGAGHRELDTLWAESLKYQCRMSRIPFFMKQMSGVTKQQCGKIPPYLMTREFPK